MCLGDGFRVYFANFQGNGLGVWWGDAGVTLVGLGLGGCRGTVAGLGLGLPGAQPPRQAWRGVAGCLPLHNGGRFYLWGWFSMGGMVGRVAYKYHPPTIFSANFSKKPPPTNTFYPCSFGPKFALSCLSELARGKGGGGGCIVTVGEWVFCNALKVILSD